MDLTRDAMLVSLRINAWSGRLHDREASRHVAIHHDADTDAGRYNKRLLPKSAFAELTETMGKARTAHYANTLPWDDQGGRLLTVANYDRYTAALDGLIECMVGERARFVEDYDSHIERARLDLGRLFRVGDYPAKEALQAKFGIAYRILPVQDARHFLADLAAGERLREDENGKPLTFRDSMIENVRDLVDVVPRLNVFEDAELAGLCREVGDRIARVDPDVLRPSRRFDPRAREQVKQDADELAARFAGYFAPAAGAPDREAA